MLCMHVGSDPERIRTIHACRHSTGIPVGQLRMPYHKARIEAIVVVIPETFRILYLTYHLRSRLFTGLCKSFHRALHPWGRVSEIQSIKGTF